jgi:hypothetical protein
MTSRSGGARNTTAIGRNGGGSRPSSRPPLGVRPGAGRPRPLTAVQIGVLRGVLDKIVADAVVIAAINNLINGRDLTTVQIGRVRGFLADPDCGLTAEEKEVVSESLAAEDEGAAEDGQEDPPAQDGAPVQDRRYLKVKNGTRERLKVYVQYRALTSRDEWKWYPVEPEQADKAIAYVLEPGEETYLDDDDFRINASRVRIWAVSASGDRWDEYKNEDLWLVPETTADGNHCYEADEIETYIVPFTP